MGEGTAIPPPKFGFQAARENYPTWGLPARRAFETVMGPDTGENPQFLQIDDLRPGSLPDAGGGGEGPD